MKYNENYNSNELSFEEMSKINGGFNCDNVNSSATLWLGLGLTLVSFVPFGALITGPSAVGLAAAAIMCHKGDR